MSDLASDAGRPDRTSLLLVLRFSSDVSAALLSMDLKLMMQESANVRIRVFAARLS